MEIDTPRYQAGILSEFASSSELRRHAVRAGAEILSRAADTYRRIGGKSHLERALGPRDDGIPLPRVAAAVVKTRSMSHGGGRRAPPFRKPRTRAIVTSYDRFGSSHVRDFFGTNILAKCNYIGFNTVLRKMIGLDACVSLARYVLRKYCMKTYSDIQEQIFQYGDNKFSKIAFVCTQKYIENGVVTTRDIEMGVYSLVGAKLIDFAEWLYHNVFTSVVWAANDDGAYSLTKVKIYEINGPPGGAFVEVPTVFDISGIMIKCYNSVRFDLQNATRADDGSGNILEVDSNPIRGTLYKFKGLNPVYRDPDHGWDGLLSMEGTSLAGHDGVLYPSTDPPIAFQVPPDPKIFANCIGYRNVAMDPGQIRKFVANFRFTGYLDKLMYGLSYTNDANKHGAEQAGHYLGQTYLFALQPQVRTGSTDIRLNFQQTRRSGAYIIPPKPVLLRRWVGGIDARDNDPPAPQADAPMDDDPIEAVHYDVDEPKKKKKKKDFVDH